MVDVIRRWHQKRRLPNWITDLVSSRRGGDVSSSLLAGAKKLYYIIIYVSDGVSVQKCTSYTRPSGVVGSSEMADPSGSSANNGLYSILNIQYSYMNILRAPPPLRGPVLSNRFWRQHRCQGVISWEPKPISSKNNLVSSKCLVFCSILIRSIHAMLNMQRVGSFYIIWGIENIIYSHTIFQSMRCKMNCYEKLAIFRP